MQDVAAPAEYWPGAQLVHGVDGSASVSAVPTAQLLHEVADSAEYVPASQSIHASPDKYWPARHSVGGWLEEEEPVVPVACEQSAVMIRFRKKWGSAESKQVCSKSLTVAVNEAPAESNALSCACNRAREFGVSANVPRSQDEKNSSSHTSASPHAERKECIDTAQAGLHETGATAPPPAAGQASSCSQHTLIRAQAVVRQHFLQRISKYTTDRRDLHRSDAYNQCK